MKIVAIVTIWLLLIASGMLALQSYKSTPGPEARGPVMWPEGSTLHREPGTATLIMLSHPRCPCTQASLVELESLLAQYKERLTVHILFIKPKGVTFEWTKTNLWRTASRIKGANVVIDVDEVEADRFEGVTSGHVLLYDAKGTLKFSGGITGARGHIGDNLGLKRLLAVLRGEETDRQDSPVFGCPLHAEIETSEEADRENQ